MRRRAFIASLGALVVPRAFAQGQPALPRVALVDSAQPAATMVEGSTSPWNALIAELRSLGYVEGKSVMFDRWSGGGAGRAAAYRDLARQVVASGPQVIFIRSRSVLAQFAAETKSVPIVAVASISAELRQPNITGVQASYDAQQIYGKQVEVLGSLLKPGARIAWLGTKIVWEGVTGGAARKAAQGGKVSVHPVLVPLPVRRSTVRQAFADMAHAKYDGVLVSPTTELYPFRDAIAELAVVRGLPALGNNRLWAEAGTLLAYGADLDHLFRRGAHLVEQILKGSQPSALPIENPTKIELIVNLETARSLNMTIPPALIARADRVIE